MVRAAENSDVFLVRAHSPKMTEKQMLTEDTPLLCNGKGDPSEADLKPSFRFGAFATGTGSAVLYLVASSSLIITNKYLMDPRRFPFAPTLTALHQLGTFILALLLWLAWPSLFPTANNIFASVHEKGNCDLKALLSSWLPYTPTGALFAVALVTSNQAYGYASVAFLQMMKEGFVLIVYVMSAAVGLEVLRCRSLVVLFFVTICAATAVYGEVHFSWRGFWLQLTAGFCESAKIVIFSWLMRGKAKADSLSVVLFFGSSHTDCTAALAAGNVGSKDADAARTLVATVAWKRFHSLSASDCNCHGNPNDEWYWLWPDIRVQGCLNHCCSGLAL
jgi:hypothetical protein